MNEPLAEALADKKNADSLESLADDLDSIAGSISAFADGPTAHAAELLNVAARASYLAERLRSIAKLANGDGAPERVG